MNLDRSEARLGQELVTILGEGAATQADHRDVVGPRLKEKEPHHRLRVIHHELMRVGLAHATLNGQWLELQRQQSFFFLVQERGSSWYALARGVLT